MLHQTVHREPISGRLPRVTGDLADIDRDDLEITVSEGFEAWLAAERAAVSAAVNLWDSRSGESGLAAQWAVMHRCATEVAYVSTGNPRWAAFWMEARWPERDTRAVRCRADGATADGVWIAHRTGAKWVGRGWVYGDLSHPELCSTLARAGIPSRVFRELDTFRRGC